jgi:hypothetical protein
MVLITVKGNLVSISEAGLLIEIEDFILDTCEYQTKSRSFFNRLARLLIDFDEVYNPDYSYFGCIEAFVELRYDLNDYLDYEDELVQQLRNLSFDYIQRRFDSYVTRHKRKLRDHRYSESENTKQLTERMKAVSKRYARILVVRLDLMYKKDYRHLIGIEDFDRDMRTLRQYIHNQDRIFEGLIEYAWALEQGADKGYHCHLLLVYKGHEHNNGYGIAKRVNELWQKITFEQGYYFNCHSAVYLRQFKEKGTLGIGMIKTKDEEQVENMLATIKYLVRSEKEEQHLRVKCVER